MSRRILLALLVPALQSCISIQIDQERYSLPNVVRGHLPQSEEELAKRNQDLLTKPLPTRQKNPPPAELKPGESPHPGRLFDPAVDPDRRPAPGLGSEDRDRVRFSEEWNFNRAGKQAPPEHCVAMSGGGVRSASFNIGVLSALHALKRLERTDILSAVSGGAYALSWYYAQHYNRPAPHDAAARAAWDDDLLWLGSAEQNELSRNARIFNLPGYLAVGAANVAMIPFNFLVNGILGWHLNTTPARSIYEAQLRRIFHTSADGAPGNIRFTALRRTIEERKLPYFIINTTALIEDSTEYLGAPLYNRVYEFTPLFFGSDALGRFRYDAERPDYPIYFSRAVSISGAALDGTQLISGFSQRTLWSLLNQDLGYYLPNPALSGSARTVHQFLPFPLYYFHHYPRHLDGTHIYLTDGGHAENLGAYGLVRRLCRNILIVDAEYDPGYEFGAYYALKQALRRDMNVQLRIEELESIAEPEWTLRKARIDARIRASGEPQAVPGRDNLPPLETIDVLDSERWRTVAAKPVMTGEIAHLPYPGRSSRLSVEYLKLAYRTDEESCTAVKEYSDCCARHDPSGGSCLMHLEQKLDAGGAGAAPANTSRPQGIQACVARATEAGLRRPLPGRENYLTPDYPRLYYCQTKDTAELRKSRYTNLDHFPQEKTTDQNFSELQFKAYRQLGYETAMRALARPAP